MLANFMRYLRWGVGRYFAIGVAHVRIALLIWYDYVARISDVHGHQGNAESGYVVGIAQVEACEAVGRLCPQVGGIDGSSIV